MSLSQPMLPFLRPLAAPRPATIRHFLRFSQSTKVPAAAPLDRNLIASQTASPSYPPPELRSLPRPKESHASHRTSQPTKVRNYPDRVPRPVPGASPFSPIDLQLPSSQVAPNLPYFVTRTPSNELPIYHLRKRGGNLMQTRVKKIDGNVDVLRKALEDELNAPLPPHLVARQRMVNASGRRAVAERKHIDCVINRVTGHVVIKGWHKPKIEAFLKARMF